MRHVTLLAAAAAMLAATPASARLVDITVTFENLAPANSVSFAPLRFGFHNGTFDAFDNGGVATAPIISVAEGGSGSDWFPAFAAAEPNAVLGSTTGPVLPGATALGTMTFRIDTDENPFFTFASMVVPSNDIFIGNDDPMEYRLFDAAGNLLITEIFQDGSEIWNAGSEAPIVANAAFIPGSVNANRVDENGVVEFSFDELAIFDGLLTAGGYVYDHSLLSDELRIARISFQVTDVPSAGALAFFGLGVAGLAAANTRRRRTAR